MLLLTLLFALIFVFIIFNLADSTSESQRWCSILVLFGIFTTIAVFTREYVLTNIDKASTYLIVYNLVLYTLYTCSILGSYPMFMFCYTYSQVNIIPKKFVHILILTPLLLQWIFFPYTRSLESTEFKITVFTQCIIAILGSGLLIYSYVIEKNYKVKKQKLISSIVFIPIITFTLIVNFILPIFKIFNTWNYNFWLLFASFILIIFSVRYSIFGMRFKIENEDNYNFKLLTSSLINHTIKNEINKISILTDSINMSNDLNEAKEYASNIIESTSQMMQMINRINKRLKDIELNDSPCDINELISNIIQKYSLLHSLSEVKFISNFKINLVVNCDKVHLQEVICNLIDNAIEAMNNKGTLTLSIYKNKSIYVLEIKDNGPGISSNTLSNIFQPFWSTKSNMKNVGLGLYYCNKIMNYYGSIDIYSKINQGTQFFLNFSKKKVIRGK